MGHNNAHDQSPSRKDVAPMFAVLVKDNEDRISLWRSFSYVAKI